MLINIINVFNSLPILKVMTGSIPGYGADPSDPLVPLSDTRLLLVLITDTGRVEQRVVELPASYDEDSVSSSCEAHSSGWDTGRGLH